MKSMKNNPTSLHCVLVENNPLLRTMDDTVIGLWESSNSNYSALKKFYSSPVNVFVLCLSGYVNCSLFYAHWLMSNYFILSCKNHDLRRH